MFLKENDIRVPIGLDVGYINRHNFEFSVVFLEQLTACYLKNHISYESRLVNYNALRNSNQHMRQD